jgi:hypothetical protein
MGAEEGIDHVFEAVDAIAIKTKEWVQQGGGAEETKAYAEAIKALAEAMSALKIRANL